MLVSFVGFLNSWLICLILSLGSYRHLLELFSGFIILYPSSYFCAHSELTISFESAVSVCCMFIFSGGSVNVVYKFWIVFMVSFEDILYTGF